MDRRKFIKTAAAGGAAALATTGLSTPAVSQGIRRLQMALTYPKNSPGFGSSAVRIANRVEGLTEGKLQIKVYGAGELVPAFESFDAVSSGAADMYFGAEYYWQGKSKAFNFFTTVPFGLTGAENYAWLRFGGGQELWDDLSAQFNIKAHAVFSTGPQMGGWFRNEIRTLDDFKGLKFRMPGLGGEVLRQLGVAVTNLPVGEIFPALQSGALDGAEWIGPWQDQAFGLHKVAKNYYYPGFHEPGTTSSVGVNKKLWDSLPDNEKLAIQVACEAEVDLQAAEFSARNLVALQSLVNDHGVNLHRYPDEMLTTIGNIAGEVVRDIGNSDATTKAVYQSFRAFREGAMAWSEIAERGFMSARALPYKY